MVSLIGCWFTLAWIDQVVGFDLILLLILLLLLFFSFFFFFFLGLDWSMRETKRQRYWKLGVQRERKNETKEE